MILYNYSVYKSSWGINISLAACSAEYNPKDPDVIKISDKLWLKKSNIPYFKYDKINDIDFIYFSKGLNIVNDKIIKNSGYTNTLIIINGVDFSFCDFQNEGLTASIIEWAAREFKFTAPKINVTFIKERNKYLFEFSL